MKNPLLYLRLLGLLGLLAGTVHPICSMAASPINAESVQDLLHAEYFQIEFFVFERPEVMEFNSEEKLALNRARAFPRSMRTHRLDPEFVWTLPLDPLTRACLTHPTLRHELLPASDALLDEIPAESGIPVEDRGDDVHSGTPEAAEAESLPPPAIAPELGSDPQLELLAAIAAFERSVQEASNRWLDRETFVLARAAARVERTGLGRLLFHGRWIQAVPPRAEPDPVFIQAGEQLPLPDGTRELEGTVGVTLGRYLHFRAELFFHAPGLGVKPLAAALTADGRAILDAAEPIETRYMVLSESRRMRSAETHYLDHPKLGLVVRIDPVEVPADLVEAFDRLEEDIE